MINIMQCTAKTKQEQRKKIYIFWLQRKNNSLWNWFFEKITKIIENKVLLQNTSVLIEQQFQMEITQIKMSSGNSTYSTLVEQQHKKCLLWIL